MTTLKTRLDPRSEEFRNNAARMREIVADLRAKTAEVARGGSEEARQRHLARGKLLPRERIDALLDPGTPFLELRRSPPTACTTATCPPPASSPASAASRAASVIVANDATVKGGTYYPMTVKKHLRAQEIARENRLPCVYLVDSGGAFLPRRPKCSRIASISGASSTTRRDVGAGIPQIAVVMGSCTAGGAYVPAMWDEAVIVQNQGTIFLGGPPLVKAATGEDVTAEELGGGDVHTRDSGVADHLAEDDAHALASRARIVATSTAQGRRARRSRARPAAVRRRGALRHLPRTRASPTTSAR